jgi:hypothetical protein
LNPAEVAALREVGSEIRIVPLVPGKSTSATIQRLASGKRENSKAKEPEN